jgi:hypothetical protein
LQEAVQEAEAGDVVPFEQIRLEKREVYRNLKIISGGWSSFTIAHGLLILIPHKSFANCERTGSK